MADDRQQVHNQQPGSGSQSQPQQGNPSEKQGEHQPGQQQKKDGQGNQQNQGTEKTGTQR